MRNSWIEPPAPDVVEVSIFGPGKGESVVLHLGENNWIIVDSCVNQARENQALSYLRTIGVDCKSAVQMVVGTHAHDDHIAGISDIFEECESAFFVCSQALVSEEFFALVGVNEEIERELRRSSYHEYRKVFEILKRRPRLTSGLKPLKRGSEQVPLLRKRLASTIAKVTALSPSHEATSRALAALAASFPVAGEKRRLARVDPNEASVALWVEVGEKAVLLGADLTIGPQGCGWGAVLATFDPSRPASLIKVPHHGSGNAHHDGIWQRLVGSSPVALLAPYRAGAKPLPTPDDISRIAGLTSNGYISASPQVPSRNDALRRSAEKLSQLARNVRDPYGKVGQVRARSRVVDDGWSVELRPPARKL